MRKRKYDRCEPADPMESVFTKEGKEEAIRCAMEDLGFSPRDKDAPLRYWNSDLKRWERKKKE